MTDVLVPCPTCRRHARVSEPACPFCKGSLVGARIMPTSTTRLSRVGQFAFASTVSTMLLVGCGSSDTTTPGTTDAKGDSVAGDAVGDGGDSGVFPDVAAYGGPPDTGVDTGPFTADAAYGGPPLDSGPADTGKADTSADTGGAVPAYGLPPPDTGP